MPEIPGAREPGEYTVTVNGRGNYTGTASCKFTMNPVLPPTIPNNPKYHLQSKEKTGTIKKRYRR